MEANLNNIAIDLSMRPDLGTGSPPHVPLVRPIPRLPWTITWYQSMWSHKQRVQECSSHPSSLGINSQEMDKLEISKQPSNIHNRPRRDIMECSKRSMTPDSELKLDVETKACDMNSAAGPLIAVLDVACCDGPVVFERLSNPNFALTVEHTETSTCDTNNLNKAVTPRQLALKTYLCIYCNQSFKSLFCYQKHKKRHLNPVSVDITATNQVPSRNSENKTTTKDLNVQFFPCKKCGSKFPSYYFVHKHRKVCHSFGDS